MVTTIGGVVEETDDLDCVRRGATADPAVALRAGPFRASFDPGLGWLRHVRYDGREAVRAVYAAVRDSHWNTVAIDITGLTVRAGDDSFAVAFTSACRRPFDFAWKTEVVGDRDGTITYKFDGLAGAAFLRNRTGICVLHPVEGCAGRPCMVEHSDGTTERGLFPADISPHQPFHDVRAISHEVAPGATVRVEFKGDVFEMEDQRNWTDASFKTYSTPLAIPFPVEVGPGTTVRQTVTIRFDGTAAAPSDLPVAVGPTVMLGGGRIDYVPAVGLGLAATPPGRADLSLLKALRPHHLRVDLTGDVAERLRAAAATAEALGARLEAAVLLGDEPDGELGRLADAVRATRPPVASWLLCRGFVDVAGADELALAHKHLGPPTPEARFGVGTNLYFTQFNRTRPPLGDADYVGFSLNPQAHAFDDLSVVETLDGQSAVAAAARRLAGGKGVAVTPVTLRPRFSPHAPAEAAVLPGELPGGHDRRQAALFAAAWTVGSYRRLAAANVKSVTYYETTGWGGVKPHGGGVVYPVYHVLADLGEVAGWAADPCLCSRPLEVEGIVFHQGERWLALVANLTGEARDVALPFAGGPCRARLLDETTARRATTEPGGFQSDPGVPFDGTLKLLPYAVARIVPAPGGRP